MAAAVGVAGAEAGVVDTTGAGRDNGMTMAGLADEETAGVLGASPRAGSLRPAEGAAGEPP